MQFHVSIVHEHLILHDDVAEHLAVNLAALTRLDFDRFHQKRLAKEPLRVLRAFELHVYFPSFSPREELGHQAYVLQADGALLYQRLNADM